MPIYTPNGLKIRLDPQAVDQVVRPLSRHQDLEEILQDVELWENLPEGMAALSASVAALMTTSLTSVFLVGVITYTLGSLIRGFTYSDIIRRLIPLFFGSWIVTTIQTIGVSIFLISQSMYLVAIGLCLFNVIAHCGLLEILYIPLAPVRVPIRHALGLSPTHQEHTFMAICNRRAKKHGIVLDWDVYSELIHR